jgi:rhodanese-related sulfurtransferase
VKIDDVFYNRIGAKSVKFFIENWGLILLAIISGSMLLMPLIAKQRAGASLDTLAATRLMNDGAIVLDVRENSEYSGGHLPNSKNIPANDLDKRMAELPSGKPVLVVCASGQRSGKAAGTLRKAGRDQVFCLDGGLGAWRQAGLPVVK